jgi:hypothetical protein
MHRSTEAASTFDQIEFSDVKLLFVFLNFQNSVWVFGSSRRKGLDSAAAQKFKENYTCIFFHAVGLRNFISLCLLDFGAYASKCLRIGTDCSPSF